MAVAGQANQCPADTVSELLSPASPTEKSVRIACSVTLRESDKVTKQIVLEGSAASGVSIDCGGAALEGFPAAGDRRGDAVVIRSSRKQDGRWDAPENIAIANCRIRGSIRISGFGRNGQATWNRQSSHHLGHTQRAQAAAPRRITLSRLDIEGTGPIPVYLAPGVTHVTLERSKIHGFSRGPAIYLDAETAHNTIVGNTIEATTTRREQIAVDGSAGNVISRNVINDGGNGGIYLYRNCGEGGAVRHQAPTGNELAENHFTGPGGKKPDIWIGSRNRSRRAFCDLDQDYDFGSGRSDLDHASNNRVFGNRVEGAKRDLVIRDDDIDNEIDRN